MQHHIVHIMLAALVGFCLGFLVFSQKNNMNRLLFAWTEKETGGSIVKIIDTSVKIPDRGRVKIPILTYHSIRFYPVSEYKQFTDLTVTPDIFEKQIAYLHEHSYHIISFDQLVDHLLKDSPLPSQPIVITFDDAWESQYLNALPVLKKYNDTATFFIFTNAIGHKHFLNWDQIKELDKLGMTIAGHTKSHPYLLKIADGATLREEIADSKKILEEKLKKPVLFFAYPFGQHNEKIVQMVKDAGYRAARGTSGDVWQDKNDLFTLKGIQVTDNMGMFVREIEQ